MAADASRAAVVVRYLTARRGLPAAASFRRWVDAALLASSHKGKAELGIRLVAGAEGRALNKRYRGQNRATNVMSFPAELPRGIDVPLLGDLVLCVTVVAREARARCKPLNDHYAHLTIHGVLHLLGHRHDDDRQARRMESLETRILADLGIGDPYA
ncbi:MAG: rRNA maturation RNase YbeY [Rhodanobacteraceae bacterium]